MNPESETTTAILEAAACLVRTGRYGAPDHEEVAKLAGCAPGQVRMGSAERAHPGVAVVRRYTERDPKSVVSGKGVSVRFNLGGCRSLKKNIQLIPELLPYRPRIPLKHICTT